MQTNTSRACKSCRSNHRYCDRTQPICKQCTIRGLNCEYYATDTKKNTSVFVQCVQPPSKIETTIVKSSVVHEHNRIAMRTIKSHIPVMSHKKLEYVLNYIQSVSIGEKPRNAPPNSELALVLSMEALSFSREGSTQIASKLFQKCYDFLSESDGTVSFDTAATSLYLGLYQLERGNFTGGKSLIEQAKLFCNQFEHPSKGFLYRYLSANLALLDEENMFYLPAYIESGIDTKQRSLLPISSGQVWSNERAMLLENSIAYEFSQIWSQYLSSDEIDTLQITLMVMILGGRLQSVKRGNIINTPVLEIACRISDISKYKNFAATTFWTSIAVVESCFVLKRFIEHSGDALLVDRLRQNVIVLKEMARRYEAVPKMFGETIQQLDLFVRNYDTINDMNLKLKIIKSKPIHL